MPEDLADGLYLAAVGMGVVFLCLVVLMLVLLALKKLFPGEEVAESVVETEEAPPAVVTAAAQQASEALAAVGLGEPSVAHEVQTEGRAVGAEVAAMAVAKYLAMEQQELVEHLPRTDVVDRAIAPSQEDSHGSIPGREPAWGNQGRRPPPYGQKTQSPYTPKDSVRE